MAGQPRNTASLYDTSASLAVNFVRASSFALAQLALGRNERALPVAPAPPTKPTFPVLAPPPASMRQLVVAAEPSAATYVMEQPASVDKLAEEYIEKRRKEMRAQLANSGPLNVNTLPPPPPKYKGNAGIIKVAIN